MGLQTYDINVGINKTQEVAAQGRYIYYLKGSTPLIDGGATPTAAGNQEIKAVAGSTQIVLMPGQHYRLPANERAPSTWKLSNSLNNEPITGKVFIGEGDFGDSNTSNTNYLKLDASFANNVTVTNDTTKRVPVSLDVAQRLPVSLDTTQTINVSGSTVAYSSSFTSSAALVANTAIQIVAPGANVNGIIVNKMHVHSNATYNQAFVAKAGAAPASVLDGDVIGFCRAHGNTTSPQLPYDLDDRTQWKIPAGRGLYLISDGAASSYRDMLYTVL